MEIGGFVKQSLIDYPGKIAAVVFTQGCNFRCGYCHNPRLVLPGHENVLGHPLDDRVPYWGDSEYLGLTYPELLRSDYPVVVMAWGESFHYSPPEK